jgi:hypothetical protein
VLVSGTNAHCCSLYALFVLWTVCQNFEKESMGLSRVWDTAYDVQSSICVMMQGGKL